MDQHEKTALSLELYRIAAGQPHKGLPVLERALGICQKLREDDPRSRLHRELNALQALMADWTREAGWWSPGTDHETLRESLNECIDHILEIATSASTLRKPRLAHGAVSAGPLVLSRSSSAAPGSLPRTVMNARRRASPQVRRSGA